MRLNCFVLFFCFFSLLSAVIYYLMQKKLKNRKEKKKNWQMSEIWVIHHTFLYLNLIPWYKKYEKKTLLGQILYYCFLTGWSPKAVNNCNIMCSRLLVFGLEQFLPYIEQNSELHSKMKAVTMKKVSDLISEFLLPAKTSKGIETHICSMKRSSTENVISVIFN